MCTPVWTLRYPPLPVSGYRRAPWEERVCAPAEQYPGPWVPVVLLANAEGARPMPIAETAAVARTNEGRNAVHIADIFALPLIFLKIKTDRTVFSTYPGETITGAPRPAARTALAAPRPGGPAGPGRPG